MFLIGWGCSTSTENEAKNDPTGILIRNIPSEKLTDRINWCDSNIGEEKYYCTILDVFNVNGIVSFQRDFSKQSLLALDSDLTVVFRFNSIEDKIQFMLTWNGQ
jgi:hypothetical protein